MKHFFLLFMALVATTALWAADFIVDGIAYNQLGGDSVEVTSKSPKYSGDITIPATVTYESTTYRVTSIRDYVFYKCTSLTSITIGNSVTSIGYRAFADCSKLSSITIPNSVTSIGYGAFADCSKLSSITIPNSVTSIGYGAFEGCFSLPVENNLRYADTYLVEAVDKTLLTYTIKDGTRWIGYYAFHHCTSLTSITIPNSVTSIGDDAFHGCTSLTTITIPNSVTSIGDDAFHGCTSLTSVTIPNSVTSIGDWTFAECSSLTTITIPNSVISIGYGAFEGCFYLPIENNLRYADTYLVEAVDKTLLTYTIKDGTRWIGDNAFYNCTSLTSITIPNSVTSIGGGAFSYCTILTTITIPNSVTRIGDRAFYFVNNVVYSGTAAGSPWGAKCINGYVEGYLVYTDTTKTTLVGCSAAATGSIIIPNSVTSIGERAFSYCTSLTTITIPNSVTSIGDDAFHGCTSLSSIYVDAANTNFASIDGVLLNYAKDTIILYPIGNTSTSYTIPNCVTSIGHGAFEGCFSLTSITIPSSVTSIGDWAFGYCISLTHITIPNSVTRIGDGAFYFVNNVVYSGTATGFPWDAKCINGYVEGYLVYTDTTKTTLVGCSAAATGSIIIPNSVTSIGERAFSYCTSLTSITIGNSVTNIWNSAFQGCYSLTSITIPNSVTYIGDYAFAYCDSLTSITSYAIVPPVCGNYCFYEVDKTIPFYVLAGSKVAYQTADTWKDFTNIQPITFVTTSVNNPLYGSVHGGGLKYDSICALTATANYGYIFTQWSDGNTDNPRSIILTQDTTFEAWFDIAKSGTCGDNLTWQYGSGTLAIFGTGDMYNYAKDSVPWIFFRDSITNIVIENGATTIGNYAFYGCSLIPNVVMPASITTIGQYAFANCQKLRAITLGLGTILIAENAFAENSKLYEITCYALDPPTANDNSFVNYRATLRVPCSTKSWYTKADVWYKFEDVSCIGAEETTTTTVTVTPTDNTATITWPTTTDAESYTIEIKKDGIVFCTLTFNAQGQLTNIAFAPGRGTSNDVALAEAVAGGYKFTITSLTPGTTYTYAIDTKNAGGTSIANYTGEFTTTGGTPTAIDRTTFPSGENRGEAVKLIRDGHLLILREGKTYDAQGELVW